MIVDLFFRIAETFMSGIWSLAGTVFSALPGSITTAIGQSLSVWGMIPGPIRAMVPADLLLTIAGALFLLSNAGVVVRAIRLIISLGTGGGGNVGG